MTLNTETYTKTLYDIASEQNNQFDYYRQLQALAGAVDQETLELQATDPNTKEVSNTLSWYLTENLETEYKDILVAYRGLLISGGHLNIATVQSSEELSEDEKTRIAQILTNHYNGEFEIDYKVDSSLLAGLKVTVNNDVFNTTLKQRLDILGGQS